MKNFFLTIFVLLFSACTLGFSNTPKEKVKDFLNKYKNQDTEVLNDLDSIVSSEYSGDYTKRYKTIMTNQYKNMEYEIVDEIIEGDSATVVAKIKVYDYASVIDRVNTYIGEHQDEFMSNSSDETSLDDNNNSMSSFDNDKYLDYKMNNLENTNDKRTYQIEFTLSKIDDKWVLDSLSETDIEKIHGLYQE